MLMGTIIPQFCRGVSKKIVLLVVEKHVIMVIKEQPLEDDKLTNKMINTLYARAEVDGIAAVRVKDGQVFLFTRKLCEDLIQEMKDSERDHCVVFVKQGPNVKDIPEN
jgi:hypothetical protein